MKLKKKKGPIFGGIKTSMKDKKKIKIQKNRHDFNVREWLEEKQAKVNKKKKDKEAEKAKKNEGKTPKVEIKSKIDFGGGEEVDCSSGKCVALGDTGGGEAKKKKRPGVYETSAELIRKTKVNKKERLKKRQKNLNKDWKQGFGSRTRGLVVANPVNRLRKRITKNKMYRLKQRHGL